MEKEYTIEITEILQRTESVKAKSLIEAMGKVKKFYKEERIILDWSDLVEVKFEKFDNN